MSTDAIDVPDNGIKRDRYGRPLVVPRGGKKPVPYTRATTVAGSLDDTFNLSRWQQRMVAIGLTDRPDLVLAVAAHRDDRDQLNDIATQALDAAKAGAAATTGTALHALTEQMDRGLELRSVPAAYQADLDAYRDATAGVLEPVVIEQFCVCDELEIGGTPDRVSKLLTDLEVVVGDVHVDTIRAGEHVIVDTKSGQIDYGQLKIAAQLGIYAHSEAYDVATGARTPLPAVSQRWGVVVHLPAGKGTARLVPVDVAAGWEAAQLACEVRRWRKRSDLFGQLRTVETGVDGTDFDPAPSLVDRARAAATVTELEALFFEARRDGVWTDELLVACRDRKAELT